MISFLRGLLLDKDAPNLTIDVNGVGYELQMPMSSFASLPPLGKELSLYTHLVIREDGESLYGFINKEQRALFRSLIKISNIGPKIALAVLSAMEPREFARHLANNDTAQLEHIPGIGSKTAKRLVVEMKDRISDWEKIGVDLDSFSNIALRDAYSALVNLGYKPNEAHQALLDLKDKNLNSAELIKLALKKIR